MRVGYRRLAATPKTTMPQRKPPTVVIISDGRGDTAEKVYHAARVQFPRRKIRIQVKRDIRSPDKITEAVARAAKAEAVIFYTLVRKDLRRAMRAAASKYVVTTVDVLGSPFRALHDMLQQTPGETPGLLYAAERERIDRMEAIDYTLKHDDGLRASELSRASVVIVGLSRVSKSSTCFLLACAGIKAANVPLILGVDPPTSLLRLPSKKVIGLRVHVRRLIAIRSARARGLSMPVLDEYLDQRSIASEAAYANRLMDEHGWRSIDASYMAIEEIAKDVMELRGLTGPRPW